MKNYVRHIRKMDFVNPIPLLDQALNSALTFIASIVCFNRLPTNEIGILGLALSAVYAVTSIIKNKNINIHFLANRDQLDNKIKSHRRQLSELFVYSSVLSSLIFYICLLFSNNSLFAFALGSLVFSLTYADCSRYLIIVFGDQKKSIMTNFLSLVSLLSLFLIFSKTNSSYIFIFIWTFSQFLYTLLVILFLFRYETKYSKISGSASPHSRILTWESTISQILILTSGMFFLSFSPEIYGEIRIAYTLFVAGPYLILNAFGPRIGFANRNKELNNKGIINLIIWFSIPIVFNFLLFTLLCINYEFLTGNRWNQISRVIPGVICFIVITLLNQIFYFPLYGVISGRGFIFFRTMIHLLLFLAPSIGVFLGGIILYNGCLALALLFTAIFYSYTLRKVSKANLQAI